MTRLEGGGPEDEEEGEDGPGPAGHRGGHQEDEEEELHRLVPDSYTAEMAQGAVQALQQFSRNWLPLLFRVFLETSPEQRGEVAAAIREYALISDPGLLATLFRAVLTKLLKVRCKRRPPVWVP